MTRRQKDQKNILITIAFYIPIIIFIGLVIGAGNYYLGNYRSLGQALIQDIITSFFIGFPLFIISEIYSMFKRSKYSRWLHMLVLAISFSVVALVASEIELVIRKTVFEHQPYHFFDGGLTYAFYLILSNILGFALVYYLTGKKRNEESDPYFEKR